MTRLAAPVRALRWLLLRNPAPGVSIITTRDQRPGRGSLSINEVAGYVFRMVIITFRNLSDQVHSNTISASVANSVRA